ncbi:MAG TPA: GAF domain-containing protein, partial [Anaerolineaceae bacterium]
MDNPRQAADPEWKQLLRLGQKLVNQPTPAAQCKLITEIIGDTLKAQVRVWLAGPVYPLPGMPAVETLPDATATPLAHQALRENKKQCAPAIAGEAIDPAAGPRSVAMPLSANNALLGVVQADRLDGPVFTDHDLSLLDGLVTHAAIAMELTRQEFIKNWRYNQLTLVRSVSQQIASLPNLDQLYDQVCSLIQETFKFYYVGIFILDEAQGMLRFRSSASQNRSVPIKPDFKMQMGEGIIGAVAQSGVELVAPDVQKETHYRYLDSLPETLSEAALPLKIENHVLGVLDFQSDALNAFHEQDMPVLRALADNIALAIDGKRLYTSLERRAEQISSVFEVGHALTSILDLDELLDEVVQLIQDRFGYPFVHVYTVHPGRRLVFYQAGTGERSATMKQEGKHYALDAQQGLISWVARSGRTFLANDVTQEPIYLPADVPPYDTRAELSVPLVVGGEVLGVLDIQSRNVNAFDENDRSLFEALAAPIAIAMRNAYLYRSEQWRRKVAESFRDVAHLISASVPINQLLNHILEKLENLLPCDSSAIWLLPEENTKQNGLLSTPVEDTHLQLAATRNVDTEKILDVLHEEDITAMLERALQNDQPLIRRPEDALGPLGEAMNFKQNYSSIAAPLRTNKRPLGLLTLAHHLDGRYGSEAQAITATFASYAAVAIQNAR